MKYSASSREAFGTVIRSRWHRQSSHRRPPNMIRAVVFDIGGTLWFEAKRPDEQRIYRLVAERLTPLVAKWGIDVPDPLEEIEREVWQNALEGYRFADETRSYQEPSLPVLIREALLRRGITISDAQ